NFPSFLAQCWKPEPEFTQPSFTAQAGIPINLEVLIRGLSDRYGDTIEWNEYLPAMAHLYSTLRRIKSYWKASLKPSIILKKRPPTITSPFGALLLMTPGWLTKMKVVGLSAASRIATPSLTCCRNMPCM